jgi:hypothetical protein
LNVFLPPCEVGRGDGHGEERRWVSEVLTYCDDLRREGTI